MYLHPDAASFTRPFTDSIRGRSQYSRGPRCPRGCIRESPATPPRQDRTTCRASKLRLRYVAGNRRRCRPTLAPSYQIPRRDKDVMRDASARE